MTGIDLSRITAIDVHTHVHRSVHAPPPEGSSADDMGAYFGIGSMPQYTLPQLAEYYRQTYLAKPAWQGI